MGRDQHQIAGLPQLPQQRDDGRLRLDIHSGEWLVQQDNPGALGDGAGEKHALALAAAQLADLAVAKLAHAHALQRDVDLPAVRGARDTEQVHVTVAPHHHHVLDEHGEVPVDLLTLRDVGHDPALQGILHRQAAYADLTARGPNEAHERLEQGRLATAVRPGKSTDRPRTEREADVDEGRVAIGVDHREAVDIDAGLQCGLTRFNFLLGRCEHEHQSPKPFAMVSTVTSSSLR